VFVKVLLVSEGVCEIYSKKMLEAFNFAGCSADSFFWKGFFCPDSRINHNLNTFRAFVLKVQNKMIFGPAVRKINRCLLEKVDEKKPDMVFIYRGTHILSSTVRKIVGQGALVFSYNNDDPFSSGYGSIGRFALWRHYLRSLPFCDHSFVYREKNISDFNAVGLVKVSKLRSYYIKDSNYPIDSIHKDIDVIFIGHYEDDGRDVYIKALMESQIKFVLYGPLWSRSSCYAELQTYLGYDPERQIDATQYNEYLNRSKLSIVFLSKLNNDTYTRRCFEIPAAKSVILCERTDDMLSLFEENKEAVYYSSPTEFIKKIHFILDSGRYLHVAEAGHQRLLADKHEIVDRCNEVLNICDQILTERK
jgi:spore maturation protein CgeB